MGIDLNPLRVVHQTGENHYTQHQKKHQQSQFLGRGAKRLYEDLEAGRVPRQLEEPHDAYDREELHDVGVLQVRRELPQHQVDVEAGRRYVVDDVDGGVDELALVGGGDEPHEDLESEPRVADALDVEEGDVGLGLRLLDGERGSVGRRVHDELLYYGDFHVRVGFQAEGEYGDADEEHGYNTYHLQEETEFEEMDDSSSRISSINKLQQKYHEAPKHIKDNLIKSVRFYCRSSRVQKTITSSLQDTIYPTVQMYGKSCKFFKGLGVSVICNYKYRTRFL